MPRSGVLGGLDTLRLTTGCKVRGEMRDILPVGAPVVLISTGPVREETIVLAHPFA